MAAFKGLRVAFHIEPYKGRTPSTVVRDMQYLEKEYGSHEATLLWNGPRGGKMLVFIYDSYLSEAREWKKVLPGCAYAIGLVVEARHVDDLKIAAFDGGYTYFASDGFVWGSSIGNWQRIREGLSSPLLFFPCVGPGYNDERIRPWNKRNTKKRENGRYYSRMWDAALNLKGHFADGVAITSWNEYHEGTNIEPSVQHEGYLDDSLDIDFLELTERYSQRMKNREYVTL